MVFYVKQGEMPESRHTFQSRQNLLREELFGEESFDGPYSLIYHRNEPTRVKNLRREEKTNAPNAVNKEFIHRHLDGLKLDREGNFFTGRQYLLLNSKLYIGITKPAEKFNDLFRSALNDQLFFVNEGSGMLRSVFGDLNFSAGDYVYVPKGTTYGIDYTSDLVVFFLESSERIGIPPRYLNIYGQIKEGSPYYSRDIRYPFLSKEKRTGRDLYRVYVDYTDHYAVEDRDENPMDVVGWDGYLYPFAININSMAPIVGKLHMPPPVHETFSGKSFMVGTFLPRKFDFHPRSIPISYYHSNIDTDEVLFYSSGDFMSRKGISKESITLHVRGLIHGPQPGSVEGAIGKTETNEVAVMIEAYDPLGITKKAEQIENKDYMKSWYK
ncbi:MAG: homogentisate 1,2-dioxygenase [Candidatus Thermoplasmatota archaeon]|nr:homogentisate 1,2-dioxygenase [Candidatus Thermoplasmatota archaeon]